MSLKFKKISGSTPYLLNSASTAEELTLALEDYMRTGAQIIFTHDGEDCLLSSFEYKTGIESTVIAYFVTPKKKLLKVDIGAGYDLVITESDITPDIDITWENLPDKPFGEITENLGDTITWDGNIGEGNDVVVDPEPIGTGTGRYVKVSDAVPTIDDIGSDSTFKYTAQGSEATQKVTPKTDNGIIKIYDGFLFIVIAPTDNIQMGKIVFPKKGVYFTQFFDANGNEIARGASLTIPNYNFGTKTTLKKIDEKYLPDTILIKSESIDIWLIDDEPENLTAQIKAGGVTINIEVVDTLPESLELTSVENGIMNVYVVESTGIAYFDIGEGAMTFGLEITGNEIYNKGWSTDISAETETGIYCVRTEKNVPTKDYVDSAVANAVATAIGNAIGGSY